MTLGAAEALCRRIAAASERLAPHLSPTPLRRSPWLSDLLEADVWLKLETVQPTGSFKIRGALNRLLLERRPVRAVAASTGNHGCAVGHALRLIGGEGTVFVPDDAAAHKVHAMQRLGVEVVRGGADCVESESRARAYAAERGAVYVSPYNDLEVVAGQGTLAVELEGQLDSARWVFVSLGGGGLAGGIASWLRRPEGRWRRVEVVGCSPENSKVMVESIRAGRILDLPSTETLSDGTAGGVEAGSITFPVVRDSVTRFALVAESEIAAMVLALLREEQHLVEGSAAVAVASLVQYADLVRGSTVIVVLCGSNLGEERLQELLREEGQVR